WRHHGVPRQGDAGRSRAHDRPDAGGGVPSARRTHPRHASVRRRAPRRAHGLRPRRRDAAGSRRSRVAAALDPPSVRTRNVLWRRVGRARARTRPDGKCQLIPVEPRFIACRPRFDEARIVLFGVPFEGVVNLRKGADHGPRDIRIASDSIETYSPFLHRDLEDLPLADFGDCELGAGSPREQLDRARREICGFWRPGLLPVMLGGDHTATVPVIEALAPEIPGLRVLQLDAHPDLRDQFLGERYNYASAMARVMDVLPPERVYQVAMRT